MWQQNVSFQRVAATQSQVNMPRIVGNKKQQNTARTPQLPNLRLISDDST